MLIYTKKGVSLGRCDDENESTLKNDAVKKTWNEDGGHDNVQSFQFHVFVIRIFFLRWISRWHKRDKYDLIKFYYRQIDKDRMLRSDLTFYRLNYTPTFKGIQRMSKKVFYTSPNLNLGSGFLGSPMLIDPNLSQHHAGLQFTVVITQRDGIYRAGIQ